MMHRPTPWLLAGLLACAPLQAGPLEQAIATSKAGNRAEADSQQRIDKLDDQTRAMLAEYQRLDRELEQLVRYDDQLQRMLVSQDNEQRALENQMRELEQTRHQVMPMMLDALGWLARLLPLDRPFLADERRQRIARLQALMDRADVGIGEKYRQLLEANQVELEYGRTLEAYRDELHIDDQPRTVDVLRVGRIGLYYQTLDRQSQGHWDAASGRWQPLPDVHAQAIRDGLRIARNQAEPSLLRLPIPAPVQSKVAR